MKCNNAVDRFMELDNYREIPLLLRLHLLVCRKCRGEVAALTAALDILSGESPYTAPQGLAGSIMISILKGSLTNTWRISGLKWGSSGAVIFISILLINFSDSFIWLKDQFGSLYTLPLSIVLGLILTAYLSIVVGCNYEALKKFYSDHFHK